MKKDKKFPLGTIWYDERMKAEHWPEDNLCDPETDAQVCLNKLKDEILGSDYYIVMPENTKQTNTALTALMLNKIERWRNRDKFPDFAIWIIICVIFQVVILLIK